tara:strand:- start:619 stop:1326 length:708 start_codon:yes stop_codon:yes gene_type:complete
MKIKNILLGNKFFYWIYKFQKIYKNIKPNHHYGEYGEDIFINRFFKNFKKGFYVDIGCYHPIKGSLTYQLFKKGWSGLNVDISEGSIDLFKIARPGDMNVNCAITNINKKVYYFQNSKINQQNSLIRTSKSQKKISINGYNFNSLLRKLKIKKIDFLNIDTEGTEIEIIKSIDFKKFHPTLITIEENSFNYNEKNKLIISKILKKNGYYLVNIIGVTMIFINKNYYKKIKKFVKI